VLVREKGFVMFKKAVNSEGIVVVGGASLRNKFPVGFSYSCGGVIYTVKEIITKEPHAEMRRVSTSAGDVEDIEITTIIKDLKEPDAKVLCDGEAKEEVKKAKTKKKKTKKKKTKKTKKKEN
jgi:hypothetical protein